MIHLPLYSIFIDNKYRDIKNIIINFVLNERYKDIKNNYNKLLIDLLSLTELINHKFRCQEITNKDYTNNFKISKIRLYDSYSDEYNGECWDIVFFKK
jgi:hypothetical protein